MVSQTHGRDTEHRQDSTANIVGTPGFFVHELEGPELFVFVTAPTRGTSKLPNQMLA
jgi:hypothetical protein